MATATSSNLNALNSAGVGALMPRFSASSTPSNSKPAAESRGSTPAERVTEIAKHGQDDNGHSQDNLEQTMPAEHSSPILTCDTVDSVYTTVGKPSPKVSHGGLASNFSSMTSFATAFGSANEETARRLKLEKYRKRLRENLAEQEALVNKRIAAAASFPAPSQRAVREFEQKIHVLAGKAQKLGRSIAQLEAQLTSSPQTTVTGDPSESVAPKPTSHSVGAGKVSSISTTNTPPNATQTTPSGPLEHVKKSEHGLHRAGSTSSSQSPSAGQPGSGDKAATLPSSQSMGSRHYNVLRDMQETFKSTFRTRPEKSGHRHPLQSKSGGRKFGSAGNLHQVNNLSNISSSSGSCETAGSGAVMAVIPGGKSSTPQQTSSQGQQPPNSGGSSLLPFLPSGAFERAKSIVTSTTSASHSGVTARNQPPAGVGEKANAGTLPARLRSSTSVPYFVTSPQGFKYAQTGDESLVPPGSATSAGSGFQVLDEAVADETASQMTGGSGQAAAPFSHSYHYQSSPLAYPGAIRESNELREIRSEVEQVRQMIDRMEKHWNEKLEDLRVQLIDVKYTLASKPSHDDVQIVNRRCEEYSATSTEGIDMLRGDFNNTRLELSRQDQDLDNAIERLRRRVEELDFDAVATRLTLVEARVSQVSNYVPGPEPSLRNVAAKLLNVLFALVALFLLLISTAISMAAPFIRTRIRIIVSAVLALVLAFLYHFWLWRLFADDDSLLTSLNDTPIINHFVSNSQAQ